MVLQKPTNPPESRPVKMQINPMVLRHTKKLKNDHHNALCKLLAISGSVLSKKVQNTRDKYVAQQVDCPVNQATTMMKQSILF